MKKLLGLLVVTGFLGLGSFTNALSCAEFPTFMEMHERAAIIITGEVTAIEHIEDMSEAEYCENVGSADDSSKLGTHTFTLNADGVEYQVSKEVTGINCTRGGSCVDMELGKEYVVLTDPTMMLQDGLCGPCPYMLKSEFDALHNDVDECICTMEYSPVCGTDGVTYGNSCNLACAGATEDYKGECGTDTPIYSENAVPNTCVSRYDGCNTCGAENGQVTFCTKMACFQQERAKCLQHEFTILNEASVSLIQRKLDEHLAGRTPENRAARVALLIERIDTKLVEINDLLMRSTFMVGSEQLKNINLTIEVLEALDSML